MRKTLLTMAAAVLALTVNAQGFQAQRFSGKLEKAVAVNTNTLRANKAPRKADLAANQRLVGYYTTDYVDNAVGLLSTSQLQPAALLEPTDYAQYAGAKAVAVRFAMGPNATANGVVVYGYNSTTGSLTELASKDTTIASTSSENYDNFVWNTVTLPANQQFTLSTTDYDGLMVSYKVTPKSSTTYPVGLNSKITDRILYMYANIPASQGGSGEGWYSFGSDNGATAVQLIVESDNFPTNGITPVTFGKVSAATNTVRKVNVTFLNSGSSVNNFDYTTTVNGVTSAEKHVDLANPLGVGGSFTDSIEFAAPAESGTYDASVTVTKVNGEANEASNTSAAGTIVAVSKIVKRGVVVEEFTGTGCQWCPRGLAGMKLLADTYPDNFIGIGIHQYNSSDPMYDDNYADLGFKGAPSCMLDRNGAIIDPYYGSSNTSITDDFNERLKDIPVLGVDVMGVWNSDSTAVEARATIDPLTSGNYNVDFVLVADSLTGSASSWNQANGYYRYTASQVDNDPNLAQFCRGGKYGKSTFKWPFDDVLIASSYDKTHNQATLAPLTEGVLTSTTYTLTLPTKAPLKGAINKSKVHVIAIVYDENGVANAAKSFIYAYGDPAGINNVASSTEADNKIVARYNAAGQRIAEAQPGLNIVKYANGKTVKVLVK